MPLSTTTSTTTLPSQQSFQASKPPLINQILPTLFSLMLALESAATVVILFLLHSLFIVTCCCYLPAYPKLVSIGWVETHQRPQIYPDCPAGLSEDPINGIEDQAPTPHITPLVVQLCRVTIECRGWNLLHHS